MEWTEEADEAFDHRPVGGDERDVHAFGQGSVVGLNDMPREPSEVVIDRRAEASMALEDIGE